VLKTKGVKMWSEFIRLSTGYSG